MLMILQPVALAYRPSREKTAKFQANAFKIGLVVMDCVFLGAKNKTLDLGIPVVEFCC